MYAHCTNVRYPCWAGRLCTVRGSVSVGAMCFIGCFKKFYFRSLFLFVLPLSVLCGADCSGTYIVCGNYFCYCSLPRFLEGLLLFTVCFSFKFLVRIYFQSGFLGAVSPCLPVIHLVSLFLYPVRFGLITSWGISLFSIVGCLSGCCFAMFGFWEAVRFLCQTAFHFNWLGWLGLFGR